MDRKWSKKVTKRCACIVLLTLSNMKTFQNTDTFLLACSCGCTWTSGGYEKKLVINKYLSLLLSTRFMFFYLLSTRDINPTKSRGLNHTIGPGLETDDCYVQVVRSVMMRNIGARYPAILYEINKTLAFSWRELMKVHISVFSLVDEHSNSQRLGKYS